MERKNARANSRIIFCFVSSFVGCFFLDIQLGSQFHLLTDWLAVTVRNSNNHNVIKRRLNNVRMIKKKLKTEMKREREVSEVPLLRCSVQNQSIRPDDCSIRRCIAFSVFSFAGSSFADRSFVLSKVSVDGNRHCPNRTSATGRVPIETHTHRAAHQNKLRGANKGDFFWADAQVHIYQICIKNLFLIIVVRWNSSRATHPKQWAIGMT